MFGFLRWSYISRTKAVFKKKTFNDQSAYVSGVSWFTCLNRKSQFLFLIKKIKKKKWKKQMNYQKWSRLKNICLYLKIIEKGLNAIHIKLQCLHRWSCNKMKIKINYLQKNENTAWNCKNWKKHAESMPL